MRKFSIFCSFKKFSKMAREISENFVFFLLPDNSISHTQPQVFVAEMEY